MKLGRFPRAAIVLAASLLSVVAAAQTSQPGTGLSIPDRVQFIGEQEPNVRKATAIVNGEVITGTDVEHRMAMLLANQQSQPEGEELQRLRALVLRTLIDETLKTQEAARNEITIPPSEVDRYYAQFASRSNQSPEQLTATLRSLGSSDRSFKREIRAEIAWQRLLGRQVEPFVNVSEDEVQSIIDRLNESRGTVEFRIAEIYLSATPETAPEVRNNAVRIINQIQSNPSLFQAYARQFSEASTAAVGGDLGWVRAAQLPTEIASVVQQMPVGAISDPIPVPGGFSVVALADTRQVLMADPRDATLSLIQLTIDMPQGTTEAQARARAARLGEATQSMGGCGGAQEVATSLGAQLVSDDRRVREIGNPQMEQLLLGLDVGQATQPFGSTERVSVIVLCGRDDPPPVSGPTPDDLTERLLQERVARRAQRYLRDLRRDAVIDFR